MTETDAGYTAPKKETRGAKNARLAQEAFARSHGLTKPTTKKTEPKPTETTAKIEQKPTAAPKPAAKKTTGSMSAKLTAFVSEIKNDGERRFAEKYARFVTGSRKWAPSLYGTVKPERAAKLRAQISELAS